jgi:hypothetical protein
VLDVSPNFSQFNEVENLDGKLLADVLKIPGQEGLSIIGKIRGKGRVADVPLQIPNRSGVLCESLLCGVASFDPQKKYSGADLLLRISVDDKFFDRPLDQESRGMAKSILRRSGSNYQEEIKRFLSDFYLPQLKYLLSVVSMQGGDAMVQSLLNRLHETAKGHNWDMQFDQQVLLTSSLYSLEMLKEAFPVLLKTATKFVSDVTDPIIIQTHMEELRSRFGDEVIREVAFLEKTGNDVRFADEIIGTDNRSGSDS